ncbi:biotin--[acetyl-CoA-carboxylase] ligase [Altererythrobacter sp. ZODW24]|uniref:biotin--[acetyl-CoA-carboxylase] ligase n=1 Tax=Altererythrobacter sp. ZODW24 TaxID=2185142 RepID=UPI000DF7CEFE|nr:biotin--[acetyl-CoA-carboxylase] ligase [Altererythrobacter sp. ZODW24]
MIEIVPETGSTNADIASRITGGEHLPEGHWLVADRQTAGRGRQGRDWFDGAGNFMGSTIVTIGERDPAPSSLALVVGLGVYETVQACVPNPAELSLKWPNDLLLAGAKLAGILLERVADKVVVGIGVNLVASPQLPDRKTISLKGIGAAVDRDVFANNLAASLDAELERWRTYGLDTIIRRWEAAAHPVGTPLKVHEPDASIVEGQFQGLTPDGAMRLRLADGTIRAIHAGDVFLG